MPEHTRKFEVTIGHPEGVSVADLKAYIEDAVGTWCGSFRPPSACDPWDPGHPLWGIGSTVRVKALRKP